MSGETETSSTPTNPTPAAAPERVELPESATVEEAVGFLMQAEDEGEASPPVNPNARPRKEGDEIDPPDPDAPQPETAAADDPDAEPPDPDAPQPEPEPDAAAADAPEFWSEDDKKVLAALPKDAQAAVSSVVRKYEQQRIQFVNEKAREAAENVRQARTVAEQAVDYVKQNAAWWQQMAPKLHAAYTDKWTSKLKEAGVQSWSELAKSDPGKWAEYEQERRDEAATLAEANQRGQADIKRAQAQAASEAAQRLHDAKVESHAVLAKKYPKDFANPEEIYNKKLGPYLVAQGISATRVNQISEAPILEIAFKAFLYDQGEAARKTAKQTAAAVLDGKKPGAQPQPNPAPATPMRVPPGAPARAANRQGEAARQVSARYRQTGSVADAARLIELNQL